MSQITKPMALDETLQDVVTAIQGITQGGMIVSSGNVGSSTQPVYINEGVPTAMSGALGDLAFLNKDSASSTKFLRGDGTWQTVDGVTGVKGNSESSYRTGNVNITKANIGLGNVDNTSDLNKPISTATQTALDGKVGTGRKVNGHTLDADVTVTAADVGAVPTTRTVNGHALSADVTVTASDVGAIPTTQKGANSGVAELDSNGKVPSSQLPSYVDDVLEYSSQSAFPSTGESGKIYVATDTNKTYRWSGTAYVEISPSLALGETSSTAYRGDRGKTAYDHASETKAGQTASGLYKVASTAQGHISSLTAVQKSDITALGIPGQDTTYTGTGLISINASNVISTTAEANQNAFSNVKVGSITVAADAKQDTLELVAGSNVTLTPDATNDKVTIAATDTTYSAATQNADGLMSSTDKKKLDGIASGAQVNTVISVAGKTGEVTLSNSDVGLGNVGNFKAVSTAASQGLTDTEKSNARTNIGAGTSSLSLGTSSSTAYRGDRGNTAYSHATDSSRLTTATATGLYKVGSTAQGHISGLTAVTKSDITALGIPAQDTTYSDMTGASSSVAGAHGLVPAPAAGDDAKFLRGDGTWRTVNSGVTGVKGNSESTYRTGNVNLTPGNLGINSENAFIVTDSATLTVTGMSKYIPIMYFNASNREDVLIKLHLGFYEDGEWGTAGYLTVSGEKNGHFNLSFDGVCMTNYFKSVHVGEKDQGKNAIMIYLASTNVSLKIHYRVIYTYGASNFTFVDVPTAYASVYSAGFSVPLDSDYGLSVAGGASFGGDVHTEETLYAYGANFSGGDINLDGSYLVVKDGSTTYFQMETSGNISGSGVDSSPTSGSSHIVKSDGVYTADLHRTSQTVASSGWTAESKTSGSGTVYAYKKEVSITGMTADSFVDIDISSGTYTGAYAVESASGKAVIRTATQPSSSLTFRLYYQI